MDADGFGEAFARHIHFPANRFHPLVWILGEPEIGANVCIGGLSEVNAKKSRVRIGDNCDIGSFVSINCADSHRKTIGLSEEIDRREIVLEENVFIGSHCFIKGGAYIGHHSVVAAGTLVEAGTIPPYSLVIGNPMKVKAGYYLRTAEGRDPVPGHPPAIGSEEEQAAARVIRTGWSTQRKEADALENEFCSFLGIGAGHAVAVSGFAEGLALALELLAPAGGKAALPAYARSELKDACSMAGLAPLLADSTEQSPHIDTAALSGSGADIGIVSHPFGIPMRLGRIPGIRLIEDCSQALGARVGGVPAGLQGDIGIFSFAAGDLMTSGGQGGMLVARDRTLALALRGLRESRLGADGRPRASIRLPEMQAAIGREQLKKLPGFLAQREGNFAAYKAAGLDLLDPASAEVEPVRYAAVLKTRDPSHALAALGAFASFGADTAAHAQEGGAPADLESFPHAAYWYGSAVSLPVFPALGRRDRDAIIARLKQP